MKTHVSNFIVTFRFVYTEILQYLEYFKLEEKQLNSIVTSAFAFL